MAFEKKWLSTNRIDACPTEIHLLPTSFSRILSDVHSRNVCCAPSTLIFKKCAERPFVHSSCSHFTSVNQKI